VVRLCSADLATPECGVSRVISDSLFFQIHIRGTEMKFFKMFVI